MMKRNLLFLLTFIVSTMTVWAQEVNVTLVASPSTWGTIEFKSGSTSNVIVNPYSYCHIGRVEHAYDTGNGFAIQTLSFNYETGYYDINSSKGGTVTAYFVLNEPCTISFNANGGEGTMEDVQTNTSYTIPTCGFTKANYTFIGWATSDNGAVAYTPGQEIAQTTNLMLYAVWTANPTVTFYANDGTETMNAVRPAYGSGYNIPSCSFTKDGYSFIGWATSADGDVVYTPNQEITLTADLTLYAKWGAIQDGLKYYITSENPYEVELMGYDGEKPTDTLTIPFSITIEDRDYSVTSIGNYAFLNCSGLTSVTIPASVTSIGQDAFFMCSGLTSVNFADGSHLTTIGQGAFSSTGLTSVTIPNSVTSIRFLAFWKCTALTSVTIPSSVTSLANLVFADCTNLTSVTIYAPFLTGYDIVFNNYASGRKIYVFSDCVDDYVSWGNYADAIEPITLTANDAGGTLGCWCTYYNGLADVTVAEGTTVYTAKLNNQGGVTLTPTGSPIIKRGEAVLLNSSDNITLSSAADSGDGVYTGNELQGVDVETAQAANKTYYVLSKKGENFGFFKLANTKKLGANKAYLAVANSNAREFYGFDIDAETTEIVNTDVTDNTDDGDGQIYDLQGRKVQQPVRGIYVKDGKKIVVK